MNKPNSSQTTLVPHKHAEVIKGWADGKPIEFYCKYDKKWKPLTDPYWFEVVQYRIKPEPKFVIKYRVAIDTKNGWELIDEYYDPNSLCMIGTIVLTNTAKQFEVKE